MTKKTKEELLKELEVLKERLNKLENADLEQKKVIEALSESEAKYRLLFDAAPVGIGIADLEGNIIDANRNMQEMSGYSLGEYRAIDVGATYADPEERGLLLTTLREKGKVRNWESRLKHKDGSQYHALLNADIMELGGRKVVLGIIRDISGSKRMEHTLCESEEKYRRLVETLMEGIWVLDKDANTTFVNPYMAQMLGFTVDEMLGKHLFSFMDETGKMNASHYLERRSQSVKEHHDFEFIRKDGTRIYTSLETSPITDENGNYSGAVAEIADITERKRSEETLHEEEQFMESIFASIQDGIGVIDRDMNIIRANKTTESWYPYAAPLVGKKCYEAYHGRKKRCEQCPAWEALKTGKSAYQVVPKHGPEGKEVGWLEIYSYPLNDTTTGKMKGVIEYVRDITERKLVEEELNKSKQLLERTFSSLSDAVFIINSETTKIIDCNKAASKIFGYEKDEMLGRMTAFLHVDEETLAEFRKKLYTAEEEKGFLYLPEFRMKRKNRECFFTENTVTPLQEILVNIWGG